MKKIYFLLMIIFTLSVSFSGDYFDYFDLDFYILTNNKAIIYTKPDIKAKKIKYDFQTNEFLLVRDKTNSKGINWIKGIFVKSWRKVFEGWIKEENAYRLLDMKYGEKYLDAFKDTHEVYKVLDEELISNIYRVIDIRFDYNENNKFIFMQIDKYPNMDDDGGKKWYFYVDSDEGPELVISESAESEYYFIDNYVLLENPGMIVVYDTNQMKEGVYRRSRRTIFKCTTTFYLFRYLYPSFEEFKKSRLYDSHIKFDPETRMLTLFIRKEKKKPFVIEKLIFTNGIFIPLTNENK